MKSAARYAIAVMLGGIFCLMMMGCAGCGKHAGDGLKTPADAKKPTLPPEVPKDKDITMKFSNESFSIGLDGQRAWSADVKTGEGNFKNGKQVFTLRGLTCHLFQQGREVLQVSADKGTAVRTGNILKTDLTGHIQAIEMKKKQQLQADVFHWVSTEKIVHVQHFAWAGDGAVLHADQGTFTIDLTEAKFTGHVRLDATGPAPRR